MTSPLPLEEYSIQSFWPAKAAPAAQLEKSSCHLSCAFTLCGSSNANADRQVTRIEKENVNFFISQ